MLRVGDEGRPRIRVVTSPLNEARRREPMIGSLWRGRSGSLSFPLLLHIRKKVFQYLCEERKTRRRRRHEYEGREGRGAAPLSDGVDGAADAAADRVSNPRARPRGCEAAAGSRERGREAGC